MIFAFIRDCLAYVRNQSDPASCKAIAIAAILFMCGPHCTPGKTDLSIRVGRFSMIFSGALRGLLTIPLERIMAHLGHLRDLWVVVIMAWNP